VDTTLIIKTLLDTSNREENSSNREDGGAAEKTIS